MNSSAVQYAPGTPSISDFMDVDNIFEQFFNDGASSTENESKASTSAQTTPPSDPPSAHSLKAIDPSPSRSAATSPVVPSLQYFDETQMENLWDSFALDDNGGFRGSTTQAGDGQIFYSTAPGGSISIMTPRPSVNSLPTMGTIHPNQVTHQPPQFFNPQKFQQLDKATIHSPLSTLVQGYHPSNTQAIHGQVTPVEDNQQTVPVFPPDIFNHESFAGRMDSPPQSRRGSISPQQSTQAGRRSRKNSKSNSVADEANVQEAKRRRFLERNRVAASKCRQKKKEWMQNLEETARNAQNNSKYLQSAVSQLKDELLSLKQELLKHHGCDCAKIRTYLMQEAEKVVVDQQKKNSSGSSSFLADIPIKSRQLSIAESEISEISDLNTASTLVDELDILADDALDDTVETKQEITAI